MTDWFHQDAALLRLQHRGEDAIAECFADCREQLLEMITLRLDRRLVGKVDAEDILQEAFVETARRIHHYLARPTVPFFVWVRQITIQILINTQRRYLGARMRDVKQEVPLFGRDSSDSQSSGLIAQLADSLTTPSQFAMREETLAEMRAALGRLDEVDREVLVLRHLEQLSNDEVAAVLGINKYAASKRYVRALERLRKAMGIAL